MIEYHLIKQLSGALILKIFQNSVYILWESIND